LAAAILSGIALSSRPAAARQATALLVVDSSQLSLSDRALRDNLASSGFVVDVASAATVQLSQTRARDVVVVSESVTSGQIGDRLVASTTPMVILEPALWDDFGMTGRDWAQDFGEALSEDTLDVVSGSLTAGLASGGLVVTHVKKKFVWGRPGANAILGAKLKGGASSRWGVFGYEAGASMVGLRAAARRVAFFAGRDAPAVLTAAGWKLFANAVQWATEPLGLLVVANVPLSRSDALLARRMQFAGLTVRVIKDVDLQGHSAEGRSLVVVSESATSSNIGSKLSYTATPVVSLEPAIFDELKMTGPTWTVAYGDAQGQSSLRIRAQEHPLAASLLGTQEVAFPGSKFVWGVPGSQALRIADLTSAPGKWGIFAYEQNAVMFGNVKAPARRVGWFAGRDTVENLVDVGVRLLDAALNWAADLPATPKCAHGQQDLCPGAPVVAVAPLAGAVTPVVGYDPGEQICEPGLTLGPAATDSNGRPYRGGLSISPPPTLGCVASTTLCDSNDNPIGQVSESQLVQQVGQLVVCPPLATNVIASCGIDPSTLGGPCAQGADCAADEVCGVICADPDCSSVDRRCGKHYTSCAGGQDDGVLCDSQEINLCPGDPRGRRRSAGSSRHDSRSELALASRGTVLGAIVRASD
jgi:hypothetical protein